MNARLHRLDPLISEFETAEDEAAYTAWLQAKLAPRLTDTAPAIPHDEVMAEIEAIIRQSERKVS
ncbi:antitoxin [Lysobacteraceae bacterium NML07-0707]|nr:antitoxin [Xanthomonadaceae bacterium NML07-0707]